MSLHDIAKHVQSQGRGKDTELVHMTPNEIRGLQQLAMAKGGSLTINPTTGLPEAGFLEDVLPTVAGAASMFIPGMQPIGAALIGGGLGLAMSGGNIQKGLMAGLGAWGGASLASGLMGAGAAGIGAEAGNAAVEGLAPSLLDYEGGAAAQGITNIDTAGEALKAGKITPDTYRTIAENYADKYAAAANTASASPWDAITKGYKATSFNTDYLKQNALPLGAAAISMLSGSGGQNQGATPAPQTTPYIRPYNFSQTRNPNYGQPGQPYFTQTYAAQTPVNAYDWGNRTFADGGQVDGGMRQGGMFPQSQQDPLQFATPTQQPISAEVVGSDYDPKVQPYTGETVRMADGGSPPTPNPQVGIVPTAPATTAYTIPQQVPAQAVADYNKLLSSRAVDEYVKALPPANMMPGGQYGKADIQNQITQNYQDLLGRAPEQSGLDYWTKLAQKGTSLGDIKNAIGTSNEYFKAHPEDISSNIASQYKSILGREADQPGLDYWTGKMKEGMSLADVQAAMKASQEAANIKPAAPVAVAPKAGIGGYSYDPVTKTYTKAPTPVPEDTTNLIEGMDPEVLKKMYADYQRQQQYQNQGATGGLTSDFAKYANGGMTYGLGGYSDGGRLLKGPGDGVSDSIPAQIGNRQPARLADGEFVIPARIVSELGNGSTDAGARRLYAMMDRIQHKRKKSVGKNKVAVDSKAEKDLPA